MINKIGISYIKLTVFSSVLFFAFSCSNDKEDFINLNQEITSTEVKTILEIDDFSSVADDVVTQIFQEGLSVKNTSKYNECYNVDFLETGFTVVFDKCELGRVNKIVSGSITINYLLEGEDASSFTAIYTNFMVGDFEINGTREFSVVHINSTENSASFTVKSDMFIELENGNRVEESGSKTFTIIFNRENIINSILTIDGNWMIKIDDDTYLINVTSDLQTNFNCAYISKGVIELNKNGLQIDVNFGEGTCDDIVEFIYPDNTKEEISLKN